MMRLLKTFTLKNYPDRHTVIHMTQAIFYAVSVKIGNVFIHILFSQNLTRV